MIFLFAGEAVDNAAGPVERLACALDLLRIYLTPVPDQEECQ